MAIGRSTGSSAACAEIAQCRRCSPADGFGLRMSSTSSGSEAAMARDDRPPRLQVEVPGEGYHAALISCQRACPVHTDARGYVRAIAEGRFEDAYLIARGPNPFASICGRVCGAPCEAACRRGHVPRVDDDGRFVAKDRPIAIRALKKFDCELAGPDARSAEPAASQS